MLWPNAGESANKVNKKMKETDKKHNNKTKRQNTTTKHKIQKQTQNDTKQHKTGGRRRMVEGAGKQVGRPPTQTPATAQRSQLLLEPTIKSRG